MKTVLITGSTDGIGRAVAKQLKKHGWRVLLHGRSQDKLDQAARNLTIPKQDTFNADFRNLHEVAGLGKTLTSRIESLDALVNNAGVFMRQRHITEDGFETTMQVNHFAHFLLTHQLLPLLKQAAGRVINVSSVAHRNGWLELDNLDFHNDWDGFAAYATSKLANILFSNELARRLKRTKVTSNALHPGVINTKLLRGGFHFIGLPASRGIKTIVYLTDSAEAAAASGKYFEAGLPVQPVAQAQDQQLAKDFWLKSQQFLQKWL